MPLNSKKICIVSPSLHIGGIERALTVLAAFFIKKGFRVYFISCLAGNDFYKLDSAVELIEPSFRRTAGFRNKIGYYLRIILFIRKSIIKIDPDVVLSFGDWFNPLVLLSAVGLKYPVFISDRTSPDFNTGYVVKIGKKILYPSASGFIAQTERSAIATRRKYGNNMDIVVIPNAIRDIEIYDSQKMQIVLYVGRLSWEKGPDLLLNAFSNISEHKDWKLVFAGNGPMEKELKSMTDKLGLYDRVEFLGKVKDIDIIFSTASIFVLPSLFEGFPNALCEAMVSGLPCICFDSIPYEEIFVHDESGIAVESGNINDLKDKMEYLMANASERSRIGNNAKEIKHRLSVDAVGNNVLEFLFKKKV